MAEQRLWEKNLLEFPDTLAEPPGGLHTLGADAGPSALEVFPSQRQRGFRALILCCGAFLPYDRMLGGIPGFNPLEASGSPSYDNPKCLQTSPNVPQGAGGKGGEQILPG